jgi:hypothetical protein
MSKPMKKLKEGSRVEFVDRCGFYRIATITEILDNSFVGRMRDAQPNRVSGSFASITRVISF